MNLNKRDAHFLGIVMCRRVKKGKGVVMENVVVIGPLATWKQVSNQKFQKIRINSTQSKEVEVALHRL